MNKYLSDKIRVISFLCIILVLYIHSGFHDYPHEIHGMAFNFKLQEAISGMLGRCAVPLFYAISGYLFFIGLGCGAKADYHKLWGKIKKRVRTLFVPYIIACLFPVVFYLLLEIVPGVGRFVNGGGFSGNFHKPISEILKLIYVDAGSGSPFAFHLWFLRDLIVIVAVSPLLLLMKRYIGMLATCLILLAANYVGLPHNPFYGMFWFVFGACVMDKVEKLPFPKIICSLLFLLLCITEMSFESSLWKHLQIPIIIAGMAGLWTLYDLVVPDNFSLTEHKVLSILCGYTFFIYLFHEPTLNIVRKLLVLPFGHSSLGFALSYLLSPWIFAAIWTIAGVAFKTVSPKFYSVLTGGR